MVTEWTRTLRYVPLCCIFCTYIYIYIHIYIYVCVCVCVCMDVSQSTPISWHWMRFWQKRCGELDETAARAVDCFPQKISVRMSQHSHQISWFSCLGGRIPPNYSKYKDDGALYGNVKCISLDFQICYDLLVYQHAVFVQGLSGAHWCADSIPIVRLMSPWFIARLVVIWAWVKSWGVSQWNCWILLKLFDALFLSFGLWMVRIWRV